MEYFNGTPFETVEKAIANGIKREHDMLPYKKNALYYRRGGYYVKSKIVYKLCKRMVYNRMDIN